MGAAGQQLARVEEEPDIEIAEDDTAGMQEVTSAPSSERPPLQELPLEQFQCIPEELKPSSSSSSASSRPKTSTSSSSASASSACCAASAGPEEAKPAVTARMPR